MSSYLWSFYDVLSFSQNSSKARLRNLENLNGFVAAATKELMWLNDKEEEEVNFDWSDRNTNMTSKKDNYSVREGVRDDGGIHVGVRR